LRVAGRDHDVDPGAVGQPGVQDGVVGVQAPVDDLGDALGGQYQVGVGVPGGLYRLDASPLALDVHIPVAVDEEVGDGWVLQVRRDGAEKVLQELQVELLADIHLDTFWSRSSAMMSEASTRAAEKPSRLPTPKRQKKDLPVLVLVK